ncbi:MAG: hypothetical protein GY941_23460 [Planctomycetes bacterium]|nr:hypothetical protein [Planctomycetota bacterium]
MTQKTEEKFISEQDQHWLDKVFARGAICVEEWPEHWIGGSDDQSQSYCYDCAEKEVDRLSKKFPDDYFWVDGGWGVEGDGTPFCETCQRQLSNEFTQYACETEVDHFLEYGFDFECGNDCLSMEKVILSAGWEPISVRDSDTKFYNNLHRLCRRILADLDEIL